MKRFLCVFSCVAVLLMVAPTTLYAAEGGGAAKPHPEYAYVQLDPLSLPIITARGLTQEVNLLVSLEVPFDQKAAFAHFTPILADAYIQNLYGALGDGSILMRGNVVDVHKIKARLTEITAKVLGPDRKVHDVLLQVVQQRVI